MHDSENLAAAIQQLLETFFHRSMRDWARSVRTLGLSWPQFGLLMRLYHGGRCEVHDVSEHFDITGPAASQLVERLVQGGLADRAEDPADRRTRRVTLTDKGRSLVEASIRERYRWLEEAVAQFSPQQRATVKRALPTFSAALLPNEKRNSV
jgi:DNA-binding MarR family transcriptional regulator